MGSRRIITPVFRLSYAQLFNPKQNPQSGNWSYQATMIFDPNDKDVDFTELKAIIEEAIQDKWGTNRPSFIKAPLRKGIQKDNDHPNGFDLSKNPEYSGMVIAAASSYVKRMPNGDFDQNGRVGLVDQNVQEIINQSDLYSGCYCRAQISAYGTQREGVSPVVSFGLHNVQKVADGDSLGGAGNGDPTAAFSSFKAPAAAGSHTDLLGDI